MKPNLFKLALLLAGICAAQTGFAQSNDYQFLNLGNGSAAGINDLGQVVGYSSIGATLWNGTTASALAGGTNGYPAAINDAGQIVGSYATFGRGSPGPIEWNGSTITQLTGTLGFGAATAINSAGQIVGNAGEYGALWSNGNQTNLLVSAGGDPLDGSATGINNAGLIVGYVAGDDAPRQAVTWTTSGNSTYLATLGGSFSEATAVNNAGTIVGQATNAAGTLLATEWKGNNVTALQSLGGQQSYAYGIDNAGVVVGSSTTVNGQVYATEWNGTSVVNLNNYLTPAERQAGWVLTEATGINQNGWIVGDAIDTKTGGSDVFELRGVSAVPEVGSWAMLLVGLGVIGVWGRRGVGRQSA